MCIKNDNGSTALIILIIVLALLGAGGYLGYTKYYLPRQSSIIFTKDLKYIFLKEEILLSTYEKLPTVYSGLVEINNELLVINQEIDRLREMELEFPQQKNMIISEKKIWEDLQQTIANTVKMLESELETLYVAYKVNDETGLRMIEGKRDPLKTSITKTMETSQDKTKRLKASNDKKNGLLPSLLKF